MTNDDQRLMGGVTLYMLLFICIAGALHSCSHAHAAVRLQKQITEYKELEPELEPELALARLCVNESGLRAYLHGDCAIIHAVITFRREHIPRYRGDSYVEALHRYSRGVTINRNGRGRPWIAHLWPDAREPDDYCPTCRWEGRGERQWLRSYEHAVSVYRGDIVAECYGEDEDGAPVLMQPHTWARVDVTPGDPTAIPIDCVETLNQAWVIPRYLHRWGTGTSK